MEDTPSSADGPQDETSTSPERGSVVPQYQELWEEANDLAADIPDSPALEKYDPEGLRRGDQKTIIHELEPLVERLRTKSQQANLEDDTSEDDIPEDRMQVPSRYSQLWEAVNAAVADASSYCLAQYDPQNLSAGDWRTSIGYLEQILVRERGNVTEFDIPPSTHDSLRALSRSELVTDRLEAVVDYDAGEHTLDEIVADDEMLWNWLQVWGMWESLTGTPSVDYEAIAVDDLPQLDETTAETLAATDYETVQDIRAATPRELHNGCELPDDLAEDLWEWVCCRPVHQIQGVTPAVHQELNSHGLWSAADITAVSLDRLIQLDSLDDKQARQLKIRAGAWLPPTCRLPDTLHERFGPPYRSLDSASDQLRLVEQAHYIHPGIESCCDHLIESALETLDRETMYTHIYDQYPDSFTDDAVDDEASWEEVLQRLVPLADQIEDNQLSPSVRDKFDIAPLSVIQIEWSTVFAAETPERATELIATAETALKQQSEFIALTNHARAVHDSVADSNELDVSAFESGLVRQLSRARTQLGEDSFQRHHDALKMYLTTCQQVLGLAETYDEYPFVSLLPVLAEMGQQDLPTAEMQDLAQIAEVSSTALDLLATLDYDHPAIDADTWEESIATAVEEQYAQILQPVEAQLSRLNNGIWTTDDLEAYDWREFEQLIGDLYRDEGSEVEVTQSTSDLGVDIWVDDDAGRTAVQVKHHQSGTTVGRESLQKLVSTLAKGDADQAVVVTSATFAETATRYASEFGPDLTLVAEGELITRLSESRLPPP